MTVKEKEKLHHLVDELPESELTAAERYLEFLRDRGRDPVLRAFEEAPVDDGPLTAEDVAAIEEGKAEIARGETVTWDEVKRQAFGDS